MRIALLLTLSLLVVAAPVAVPSVAASDTVCSPMWDFFQLCATPTDPDCLARVKFGGDRTCVP
jgi:hypothetical protein